ncbi:type IV secretory pathway ATPase VirB11/archaellum biosynthesis ATPase [Pseudoclavibacter chungangensis]|nr:type II/IV secretion system ATPase subunit [Pseudoclavibacter chungangensis]NYJ65648.1 type IV secretory pathway ATPase VirB11/archaellum biosynthesis ATPase [Pseudoclavibacter chungangensis]
MSRIDPADLPPSLADTPLLGQREAERAARANGPPDPAGSFRQFVHEGRGTGRDEARSSAHRPEHRGDARGRVPQSTAGALVGELDWEVVARLRHAVSDLLTRQIEAKPSMSEQDRRAMAQSHIAEVVREEAASQLRGGGRDATWSQEMQHRVSRAVFDALFKLGRLQPLVDEPGVENIDIFGHDNVYVSYADGSKRKAPAVADSDEQLVADIAFLAQRGGEEGRSFTAASPDLDMDLPGGARLAAVHPPISPRPKVVIRIHRFVDISLADLIGYGTLTPPAAAFLSAAVKAGVSVVVAGAPSAGKTTFVRALANEIDPFEEIVTIEKERELHLDRMGERHRIVTALQYRPGQGEAGAAGAGEVGLVQLLEKALRLNAERIIVGEVRGGEVDAMFQAMQAGVGSLSTIHASSPTDTIERLASLTLKNLGTSDAYAYRQITQHIGLIVQIRRVRRGGQVRRVVTHISQVQPGESAPDGTTRPVAMDVFAIDGEERLGARHLPTGALLGRLREVGFDDRDLRGDRGGFA